MEFWLKQLCKAFTIHFNLPQAAAMSSRALVLLAGALFECGLAYRTTGGAAQLARTTEVKLKVATLNCLEVGLSSSTPAGFATKSRAWVDDKDTDKDGRGRNPTWLTQQLNKFWDDGVALVSLQEVDQPSDLSESRFHSTVRTTIGCPTKMPCQSKKKRAHYIQLSNDIGREETAYLAWNPKKLKRTKTKATHYPGTGLMMFEFKVFGSGKTIKVMAGHADSAPPCNAGSTAACWGPQKANITAMNPDIVMMDANQNGATALMAYGDNYAVYPSDPQAMTSMKVVYFYRKLAQAVENTGFFEYLPKGTTCAKLVCSDGNTVDCCGAEGKYAKKSETNIYNSTDSKVKASKALTKTCQYASRVCGGYDKGKSSAELVTLLQQPDGTITEENVADAAKSLDLTELADLIRYHAPEPSWSKKTSAQEDIIIYKKPTVGFISGEVYPSFTSGRYAELGRTEGFPNTVWPSDHLLVTAEVTV